MAASDEPPSAPTTLSLELHEHTPSLSAMRRWISDAFGDLSEDVVEDAQLAVTELVSNAYDHGRHPRQLRLRRIEASRCLRIEVDDASPDMPTLGRSRLSDTRGRGLIIVNKIAEQWGVLPHSVGKTVWAELLCD
ncbi:ATP-binding protein [Lentzea flaviverrucosa]|uniref:Anti-sigma regulatory factor (Ser/Thr protein kinase) n=1 Tax=Lentzea flaviverrucosa TaxID=200379 RepID=A0A1H9XXG1_9PSEU|nr:ATP-binding protein [Lentzea flaviverrucosa]RDI18426.1 anti-sigma regulatory factor (Ser/Thr protein kinase) [Lentzea flaviverrucosa]SES50363.1 Anti-sigma regulatory factor (Ser/Thr protein kinase) [Lentzea flaviverrucosa]